MGILKDGATNRNSEVVEAYQQKSHNEHDLPPQLQLFRSTAASKPTSCDTSAVTSPSESSLMGSSARAEVSRPCPFHARIGRRIRMSSVIPKVEDLGDVVIKEMERRTAEEREAGNNNEDANTSIHRGHNVPKIQIDDADKEKSKSKLCYIL